MHKTQHNKSYLQNPHTNTHIIDTDMYVHHHNTLSKGLIHQQPVGWVVTMVEATSSRLSPIGNLTPPVP